MVNMNNFTVSDLKIFLDEKVARYNQPAFIQSDPVCIPHLFTKKQDKEIAGFFASILHGEADPPSSINQRN